MLLLLNRILIKFKLKLVKKYKTTKEFQSNDIYGYIVDRVNIKEEYIELIEVK